MCHCCTDDISGCCCIQSGENPTQSFSKTRLPFVFVIQYSFYPFYDSAPNSNWFFTIFVLCWFTCIQSAIEYLRCISDLNVGVKIENVGDCFIVSIYELTTHGSFWKDHKWIYSVDWSIQKVPQSFILIFVTFVLVDVCRLCRHEREEKSAFIIFSWSTMHYEWMNVLQICTWAMFPEHWYRPKMDRSPIHNLHSCDMRKCMQPCLTFLSTEESLCLVCYVELYLPGSDNLSIFLVHC